MFLGTFPLPIRKCVVIATFILVERAMQLSRSNMVWNKFHTYVCHLHFFSKTTRSSSNMVCNKFHTYVCHAFFSSKTIRSSSNIESSITILYTFIIILESYYPHRSLSSLFDFLTPSLGIC